MLRHYQRNSFDARDFYIVSVVYRSKYSIKIVCAKQFTEIFAEQFVDILRRKTRIKLLFLGNCTAE